MNRIKFEFLDQYRARRVFRNLFNNGVFKSGFREAVTGPTIGALVGSKIFIESSKYNEKEIREFVEKQKSF